MGTSAFGTWQPMSTAPRGTWILTYSQDGVIRVALRIDGAIHKPTHWMPLPPPPKLMVDAGLPKPGPRGPYRPKNS